MRTVSPEASSRWIRSASSAVTAAAGIRGADSWYDTAPVCSSRAESVPTERTSAATAPSRAASEAPRVRWATAGP